MSKSKSEDIKNLAISIERAIQDIFINNKSEYFLSKDILLKMNKEDFLIAYLLAGADFFYTLSPLKNKKDQTIFNFIMLINIAAKSYKEIKNE